MSILQRPRLHFSGTFNANTPTGNNNNYDLILDPDNVAIFAPYDYPGMSDEAFRETMRSLILKDLSIVGLGKQEVLNANWDYYGENSIWLDDATITSYDPPDGDAITSASQDPIIGKPVGFFGDRWGDERTKALIVDSDPTGDISSQLFITNAEFGAPGCSITAETTDDVRIPRAYSRWVDFARNLSQYPDACFAAIWQLGLPVGTLSFDNGAGSKALETLQAHAENAAGFLVRFSTFYFNRKFSDPELADKFKNGEYVQNVSRGPVVGSIGIWEHGELASMPAGRILQPSATIPNPVSNNFVKEYSLCNANAALDRKRKRVVLDLITAFPECNADLDKIDLGTATLQVRDAGGAATAIGSFAYDKASYDREAGLVEIPYDASQESAIDSGTLEVVCDAIPGKVLLTEKTVTAASDDRAVYVSCGSATTITVRVFDRGAAPSKPIALGVEQYRSTQRLGPVVGGISPLPVKELLLTPSKAEPVVTVSPESVMVGTDGSVSLTLSGIRPGLCKLRFLPGNDNPPDPQPGNVAPWMVLFYVNVRVLPTDDQLDKIPDAEVSWQCVYDNVLRYYYKLYPTMDAHMRLNDKQAIVQRAQMLRLLVDESNWFSTLYMPVTRELSDGKRRLLQRWCARVERGEET